MRFDPVALNLSTAKEAHAPTPRIRPARAGDMDWIAEIYGHYVRETVVSFEFEAPTPQQMRRRWRRLRNEGCPYLVAVAPDGVLCGFAFLAPYKSRAAYRKTVEDSIYVARGYTGRGVGRQMLSELLDAAQASKYRQIVAGIADDGSGASIALHSAFNFRVVGRLRAVGRKFGRNVDIVLMQKSLSPDQ